MYTCKYLDDLRTFCFILFFVYLFVYFFSFFFLRMINLSGERNWKTIFSPELTVHDAFFNDFHWKCISMARKNSNSWRMQIAFFFFLVLQFIKGICSFFFYFFFSLFHSIDQHVQRDIELPNTRRFSMLLYFAGARTTSNLIDRYFDEISKEWYRFYITFKRHVSSILESKFNLYSLDFSILFSNTFSITVWSQKFWRELFLFLQLLQIY